MSITVQISNQIQIIAQFIGFSGGERHVQLTNLPEEPMTEVLIRANVRSSDGMMDLLLLEDALLRHSPDVQIDLELPYLPYARQDRVCATGQAFSMDVMAKLLHLHPKRQIAVWDAHSAVSLSLTQAHNVLPETIIAHSESLSTLLRDQNTVLICPDKGAVPRCEAIQKAFNTPRMVYCEKKRDPSTGRILRSEVLADDLSGKTAVITDDICDGGMTFIGIAQGLRALNCQRIVLYATHGIFSKGLSVFDGLIDQIYTSNSFIHASQPQLTQINFQHPFGG
ncbi:ribose-phosphate pyrophosphokinase [Formosimonas limnophila]|uniref:Ribose-phosphate pyrophosphokinase n=1 Tax=Formosimonas limnophila TaxID=1384487 RepID=A0A8J3FZT8_9BURK|nr:ribose-phosphate diphosphokinase [Formosimonas limnophila]GHA71729.1 ribose-phosphate pyrophosphokinase [Formosimonas limnophila]